MTPDDFAKLAELAPDALFLLSGDGRILAANCQARTYLERNTSSGCSDTHLHELVRDRRDEIDSLMRTFRRNCNDVVGSLWLKSTQSRTRVYGRLLERGENPTASIVLCRIPSEADPVSRFSILTEKIDELSREISRRRHLESELREQRDLASFGRDVGLALAHNSELPEMLQQCGELLVHYFDAAFARIWVMNAAGTELHLWASAGQYRHLDGPHSKIRVGQYKIGLIAAEGQPTLTNKVIGDERIHDQEWARREGLVSFAGYPLIVDRQIIGVMALFARHELSASSFACIESVANSIALGIRRKQVNAKLEHQAKALRLADQRKDEFLAMLAHELRNPLAPIRSVLEVLQLEYGDNATLALMHEQVQHLTRMVDDLLDVSRIMRGRIELRREIIQLDEIIEHAASTVQTMIKLHRHTLCVRQCPTPIWLYADRVRLGQIITNLLNNAAKYTPDGGQIVLETAIEGEQAVLRVRDNGIGIEADFLPQIFELFAQSERGLARSEGGLGIGLTLVRRLVQLHGGEIHVTSEGKGTGSEFLIRLGLSEPGPPPQTDQSEPWVQLTPDCRILVVDDSVGSAKILRLLLSSLGACTIELAHDGPSTITTAESFRPDIIFLDIGLPGLSGFEVAERLRADDRFKSTRLIALTGYGTEEDRRKSRKAGFDWHLVKPVGLDELKAAISDSTQPGNNPQPSGQGN